MGRLRVLNTYFISNIVGFVLIIESILMLIAALIGLYYQESSQTLFISSAITLVCGAIFRFISFGKKGREITKRESFVTVTLVWIFLTIFGLLPYYLSGSIPRLSDAFFETMCGFTTTGSSVIVNLEGFPKALLFWRSLTQWIGGIGIVVFVMAFLPLFGGSAIQLFDAEVTGFMQNQQITPRINKIAKLIAATYLVFTLIGFLLLWMGPMSAFDAICHTLTSISTGGFSTKQTSIAYFDSAYIEYIIILLMFVGGTNFLLLYLFFRKRSLQIFKDEEFRWYLSIIAIFTLVIGVTLLFTGKMQGVEYTFRTVLFQVVSNITTSGFAVYDYLQWGHFYWFLFLALMLFCACEGSTSGGMKISRLIILVKNTLVEFKRQVHPSAVLPVKINRSVVSTHVVSKILAFMFLYTLLIFISFLVLSLTGMNFDEAIGASITAISNVGPGLGANGPAGNFANITSFAKIYMSFLMLVGRLEIFTVLSLFIPSFWK